MTLFADERSATFKAIDAAWENAYQVTDFNLEQARYVILSDSHKGDRRRSDDFQKNEYIYCYALKDYYDAGYHLVLNGDVEEGWENDYSDIVREYRDTAFAIERHFADEGRYLRIFGNHDYHWNDPKLVEEHLWDVLGQISVYEAVRLGNKIFILHGHQGQPFDDPNRFRFSHLFVRHIWAPFVQRFLGLGGPSASKNKKIRKKRDTLLYEWAKQHHILLIAGHTHEAMFQSESKIGQTQEQLESLPDRGQDYELLAIKRYMSETVQEDIDLLAEDQARDVPCYFNDGCCVYSNGITGIEIDRGQIRLVKWEISDAYCDANVPSKTLPRHPEFGYYVVRRIYQEANLSMILSSFL